MYDGFETIAADVIETSPNLKALIEGNQGVVDFQQLQRIAGPRGVYGFVGMEVTGQTWHSADGSEVLGTGSVFNMIWYASSAPQPDGEAGEYSDRRTVSP